MVSILHWFQFFHVSSILNGQCIELDEHLVCGPYFCGFAVLPLSCPSKLYPKGFLFGAIYIHVRL
jgi:hypothetical protein